MNSISEARPALSPDDKLIFADEIPKESEIEAKRAPWKILIADDEEEVHTITRMVMEDFPGTRVVIVSGHANEEEFKACLDIGAFACFHKPVNIDTIIKARKGSQL